MLTKAEKKWLEERQDKGEYNFYYCQHCNKIPSIVTGGLCAGPCPMYPGGFEYEDAAEFEGRVAESIARGAHNCALDEMMYQHQEGDKPQGWYSLRDARLVVEQEMENGSAL